MDLHLAAQIAGDLRRSLTLRLTAHAALLRQPADLADTKNLPLALAALCEATALTVPRSDKAETVVKLLAKMISDAKSGVRFHDMVSEDGRSLAQLVGEALTEMGGVLR